MCSEYAEPFKGGPQYAPSPPTLRQYNLSFPLVSRYPYMAMPNIQRNAMNGYDFQQNKPLQQYQPQVNDAFNPIYLKPAKPQYSFAPQKNYSAMAKVSALPAKESDIDLAAVIANELGTLMSRKKKILVGATS